MTRPAWSWLCLGSMALIACEPEQPAPLQTNERSPNAGIQPAPLASPKVLNTEPNAASAPGRLRDALPSALTTPHAIREDQPVAATVAEALPPESLELKARFQWADLPATGQVRDLQHASLERIQRRTALNLAVTLSHPGGMRLRFDSAGFMFPDQSEIRARQDLLGHILVWPKGSAYRTLPLGSLRAVFLERRVDVTPLIPPNLRKLGQSRVLEHAVEEVELGTSQGKLALSMAPFPGFEASATLLCRFLVELIAADPENAVCESGNLPLRAEFHWAEGGQLAFLVEKLKRGSDAGATPFQVPPSAAHFSLGDWPPQDPLLADTEALASLRTSNTQAKDTGLTVVNNTDLLRYVLIDATPVAWVLPGASLRIRLPEGRYQIALRDFLGQNLLPARLISVPTRIVAIPEANAGADPESKRSGD